MNVCSSTEFTSDASNVSIDCASKQGHVAQWQQGDEKCVQQFVCTNHSSSSWTSDQDYSFSAAKLKQLELALSTMSSASETRDEFYTDEYNNLIAYVEQDYDFNGSTACERDQVVEITHLADYDLSNIKIEGDVGSFNGIPTTGSCYWDASATSPIIDEIAMWDETWDIELFPEQNELDNFGGKLFLKESLKSPDFQHMVEDHLRGFGEKRPEHWEPHPEDENRKRRLCRHFLKGHCKRGRACDFLHDPSIFCPDYQKVFLGGLPAHITETTLQEKLTRQGYTVINKPKVLRGFTPQVCLGSVEEAQKMIKKGRIFIDGSQVDVRPYEAFAKEDLDKRLPDDTKRSVFIGGLSNGTTGQMIINDLEKLDVKVVNHPLIKTGFTPKVTLGTVEQAQKLIKMKRVRIHHSLVDIRPYVNFRDSPSHRKKKY